MKSRRTLVLSILAITILCLSVVGLTFAYFAYTNITDATVNVNIETSNQAYIYYNAGDDFELVAKQPGYSDELNFWVKLVGENKASVSRRQHNRCRSQP